MYNTPINPLRMREVGNSTFKVQEEDLPLKVVEFSSSCQYESRSSIDELKQEFQLVLDEQGLIGGAFDFFKNIFHTKYSSNNIQEAINSLNENSTEEEIDEVRQMVEKFSSKQDSFVDTASTTTASVAAGIFGAKVGATIGTAIFPGIGTVLGGILGGAIVGIIAKVGINQIENVTDRVKGNSFLNDEKLAQEILTGAVVGGAAVASNSLTQKLASKFKGWFNLTAKGVSKTSIGTASVSKSALYNGLSEGFAGGAAATFESDAEYLVNVATDENKKFDLGEFGQTTVSSFVLGGLLSGSLGAAHGAKSAKQVNHRIEFTKGISPFEVQDLSDEAYLLSEHYKTRADEATKEIQDAFSDLDSVDSICGRPKGENSVYEKLAAKRKSGDLRVIDADDCYEIIADAYGTRVCAKNLTKQEAQSVIDRVLKEQNLSMSCDDFYRFLSGDSSNLNNELVDFLFNGGDKEILKQLKELQTGDIVKRLCAKIKNGDIAITELNNYGDDISAYFTKEQLEEIADAYFDKTHEKLLIKTREEMGFGVWEFDKKYGVKVCKGEKYLLIDEGEKVSGYASAQMNTKHCFEESEKLGSVGFGELQIRGSRINAWADMEHVVYDIRKGKIKITHPKYGSLCETLTSLSDESMKKYNGYMTKIFDALRLRELGVNAKIPKLDFLCYTDKGELVDMAALAYEALIALKH